MRWNFPKLGNKLAGKRQEVALFIAAQMQTNRGLLFDASGDRNGHEAWDVPLLRVGQPNKATGTLAKSLGPNNGRAGSGGLVKISGGLVTIGTRVAYAKMANFGTTKMPGGVLRPKNAKALAIPLPAGKRATETAKSLLPGSKKIRRNGKDQNVIFRKFVRIPERRFDTLTSADKSEIGDALKVKLGEVLRK